LLDSVDSTNIVAISEGRSVSLFLIS
jgi:hypothetical protein